MNISYNVFQLECSKSTVETPKGNQYLEIGQIQQQHHINLVILLNIRSINANFDKITELISNFHVKPDIIRISETWINVNRPFLYDLPGYDFVYKESLWNAEGVAFFILNTYSQFSDWFV